MSGYFISPKASFLKRLFTISTSERDRREDFLTEILAELLACLDHRSLVALVTDFFLSGIDVHEAARWQALAASCRQLQIATQVWIDAGPLGMKRPDIVIFGDGRALLVVECKVDARYTESILERKESAEPEVINQLQVYGGWLQAHGHGDAGLVLLTQFSDPPSGFLTSPEFTAPIRNVKRWSDLYRFLTDIDRLGWLQNAFKSAGSLLNHFTALLRETNLMIDDVTAADFAAARLFLATTSYKRLAACVNEASKAIKLFLKPQGYTSFSGAYPDQDENEPTTFVIADNAYRGKEVHISWGFWFSSEDVSSIREYYEPDGHYIEGVSVAVAFNRPLVRPTPGTFPNWFFPKAMNDQQWDAFCVRPFHEFIGLKNSTLRMAEWLEAQVREAVDIVAAVEKPKTSL